MTDTKFNALYYENDIIVTEKMDMKTINFSAIAANKIQLNDGKSMVKPIDINKQIAINFDINGIENENAERIWAYLKLQELSKQKLIEEDDDEKNEEQSLGLELGMKYKFVIPWTSMIVVKHEDKSEINAETYISKTITRYVGKS